MPRGFLDKQDWPAGPSRPAGLRTHLASPDPGDRASVGRLPERWEAQAVFDRAQEPVVVEPCMGDAAAADERAEDERRDMSSAPAHVLLVALIEDNEDNVARAERRQDATGEGAEPAVARPDRAVVHVV